METQKIKNRKRLIDDAWHELVRHQDKYKGQVKSIQDLIFPRLSDQGFDLERLGKNQWTRLKNDFIDHVRTMNLKNANSIRMEKIGMISGPVLNWQIDLELLKDDEA